MNEKEFIIISQGDVSGISWPLFKEIIRNKKRYFNHSEIEKLSSLIIIGFSFENDLNFLNRYFLCIDVPDFKKGLEYRDWILLIREKVFDKKRKKPVFFSLRKEKAYIPGEPSTITAMKSYRAFQIALRFWKAIKYSALVTLPVSKEMIMKAGIWFTGHTRMIEKFTGNNAFMCMYHPNMSVMVLTEHIPLSQVPVDIYHTNFLELEKALKFFSACFRPKNGFAMSGLNPHAGENGKIGKEESFLYYHLKELQKKDIPIEGLIPADSVFVKENRKKYSLIIAHYHDQGLVPFKALIGLKGINVTLNQPRLRVSPAHGTAYDLVRTNSANPESIIKSIKFAMRYNKQWIRIFSSR